MTIRFEIDLSRLFHDLQDSPGVKCKINETIRKQVLNEAAGILINSLIIWMCWRTRAWASLFTLESMSAIDCTCVECKNLCKRWQ